VNYPPGTSSYLHLFGPVRITRLVPEPTCICLDLSELPAWYQSLPAFVWTCQNYPPGTSPYLHLFGPVRITRLVPVPYHLPTRSPLPFPTYPPTHLLDPAPHLYAYHPSRHPPPTCLCHSCTYLPTHSPSYLFINNNL
jgi:hypothetical protein